MGVYFGTATSDNTSSAQLPSCRLTMSIPTNNPLLKPLSSLKKAIARSRSRMPQSADIANNDLAHSCDLPNLISPSSTIHAADIAMSVTSKKHFNLPAPKWTLIAHQIKFAGDQVEVPGEVVIERLQQVLPTPTGLH